MFKVMSAHVLAAIVANQAIRRRTRVKIKNPTLWHVTGAIIIFVTIVLNLFHFNNLIYCV